MVIKRLAGSGISGAVKARTTSAKSSGKRAGRSRRDVKPDGYQGLAKPAAQERPATPLPSLPLGDGAVKLAKDDMPENQPTARFAGKPPALERPDDPLPTFLG